MKGIANPINRVQEEFNRLCKLGGGIRGGPSRDRVLELLRSSGLRLNAFAYREMNEHLAAFPAANPWHICFAIGLCWGHLARLHLDFTEAVVGLLENWNSADLKVARSFHMERGATPIEQSLVGAHMLFRKVRLPPGLPSSLVGIARAQDRWLSPIISGPERPPYIGSWSATAMFMCALFAQPSLAQTQTQPPPALPPAGPIFRALELLFQAGVINEAPSGSALDDESFEPGAVYVNNGLLAEVRKGRSDWCLIDVHSGVYLLGTQDPNSDKWT